MDDLVGELSKGLTSWKVDVAKEVRRQVRKIVEQANTGSLKSEHGASARFVAIVSALSVVVTTTITVGGNYVWRQQQLDAATEELGRSKALDTILSKTLDMEANAGLRYLDYALGYAAVDSMGPITTYYTDVQYRPQVLQILRSLDFCARSKACDADVAENICAILDQHRRAIDIYHNSNPSKENQAIRDAATSELDHLAKSNSCDS